MKLDLNINKKDRIITLNQMPDKTDFSLEDTLDCGQAFAFTKDENDVFTGVVRGKVLKIKQEGKKIIFYEMDEKIFHDIVVDYFDLNLDYKKIIKTFEKNEVMKKAIAHAPGIRVLKQETWETLISFICSQNNNIGRIKGMLKTIRESFGEEIEKGQFSFPAPERLSRITLEELAPVRAGFRAKYLIDAIEKVSSGKVDLQSTLNLELEEARQHLQIIKGVGPKVAECVLLFGSHRLEAFPMDVWMKRAMQTLFKDGLPDYIVPYGGIAQQFIFHYVRMNPEIVA